MQLELRQKFLQDQIKPEELVASAQRVELMLEQELAQQQFAAARQRLESVKRLFEVGMGASQLDIKRAEVELLEMEVKVKMIRQQIEAMKKK